MKILELRFKNINSLYGEWAIDFTEPEYVSNGIFAVAGPTGAGKSTVLDAICLALYGATPRLGKITKSKNEIMSRQTGECYAEVLFESQLGRFRCHWEQRCARKIADGNLQDPEHQIMDANTKKPIETQKSRVSRVIEEKTGMDFDRFTRSILLAQGGFDTFLKADVEQKSKILEQITGTEIYSKISQRVHERQREEKQSLDILQEKALGIDIMNPKQEKETQQELEIKQKKEKELHNEFTETENAITQKTRIDKLQQEINDFSKKELHLEDKIEAFKPEREKLNRAIKASELDGLYAKFKEIQRQQLDTQMILENTRKTLPALEFSTKEQVKLLESAEQKTINAKNKLQVDAPLIQKVRSIDQRLAEQKESLSGYKEDCKNYEAKINADVQSKLAKQKQNAEIIKKLTLVDKYLQEHAQDERLISDLTGIESRLDDLTFKQEEMTQKKNDYNRANEDLKQVIRKLEKCKEQQDIYKQKLESVSKNLQKKKEDLDKLLDKQPLREYRTEKDTLLHKKAFLSKIKALEENRANLEDGKPCPLCGSKEHPFAEGNVPVPDEIEQKISALTKLINKAEVQKANIEKLEEDKRTARDDLIDNTGLKVNACKDKKTAQEKFAELNNDLKRLQTKFTAMKQTIYNELKPLGIMNIPDDNFSSLTNSLRERLDTWKDKFREKSGIKEKITKFNSEISNLDAVIRTKKSVLFQKQEILEKLKKEHAAENNNRKQLYEEKIPSNEERHLKKVIDDAERLEKKTRKQYTESQQELNTKRSYVGYLKKEIERKEPGLKEAKDDFAIILEQNDFSNEKQFLEARVTTKNRNALSTKAKKLDDGKKDIIIKKEDRKMLLKTEIKNKITDKDLKELKLQFEKCTVDLEKLRSLITMLKYKLDKNTVDKEEIKEKQTAIEAQEKEYLRWKKLHELIGSADGKKYRNFAQGLTFELMVSHANHQLEKMTDRYLLIHDKNQLLELNVIDNYQAGEIRSTKNLSGGESFIVSLTLALGLSKMASSKVRVDSLFLDEGFGTLDEEALETALETLSGLQQEGKLIGIISHIPALKERIGTQINITPVSGGRSSIVGPGCKNCS